MSDSEELDLHKEETITTDDVEESTPSPTLALDDEESTGSAALDKLLEEGILKGMARMGLAQILMAAFVVMAMGWFAYTSTLTMSFLLDEQATIVEQEALHRIPTISAAWNESISPITAFTYAANWGMGDGTSFPFRITQLLIHLFNAVLVFVLCRSLMKDTASEAIPLTGGLLFVLHPLVSFTVTPLVERDVLLATFFLLSSLVLYLMAIRSEHINLVTFMFSIIAFSLAWTCGTWVWVLPLLIVLLTLTQSGWTGCKQYARYIALYAIVSGMLIGHGVVTAEVPNHFFNIEGLMSEMAHILSVWSAWWIPGSATRAFETEMFTTTIPMGVIAMVIAGGVTLVRWPRIGLVILWPIFILAGFGLAGSTGSFNWTHAYPAGIGIVCLLPILIQLIPQGKLRTLASVVAGLLIITCLGMTHLRNTEWKDEVYFWTLATADCESCYVPNAHLAELHKQEGDQIIENLEGAAPTSTQTDKATRLWSRAEGYYTVAQAAALGPDVLNNPKAQVQAAQGKLDEAIDTMKQVVASTPSDIDSVRLLAQWYVQRVLVSKDVTDLHKSRELYTHLNTLTELTDTDHLHWGIVLFQLGAFTESGQQLQLIKDTTIRKQASSVIQQLNPRLTSINTLRVSVQQSAAKNLSSVEVLRLRTAQFIAEGNLRSALYFAEEIQRSATSGVGPEDWFQLGHLYGLQGEWAAFLEHWPAPVQATNPWQGMAEYCVAQRNWNTAMVALVKRPVFPGMDPGAEAMLSLSQLAIQVKEYTQAGRILQGMVQQFPKRFEPWLTMGTIAIATKKPEVLRTCLREAKVRGASDEALQALRDEAGIEEKSVDTLVPTIIR